MHRISGLPEIERPVFGQKASFLWAGPSGRIARSAWSAVEDSTIIVVEVADELPRLRHRVRLRKVSNATKLPADSGLHPASRTVSIERAAPSHLNYFSEQKYCLPGLPSGSSLVTAGPEPVPNPQSFLSRVRTPTRKSVPDRTGFNPCSNHQRHTPGASGSTRAIRRAFY